MIRDWDQVDGTQEIYEALRGAHIARHLPGVTEATLGRLRRLPNSSQWLSANTGMAYFGPGHMARDVQVIGLGEAAATWGVRFLAIGMNIPRELVQLTQFDEVIVFTYPQLLPFLMALRERVKMRIALLAPFYDVVPKPGLGEPLEPSTKDILTEHRGHASLVLSEFSPEGNELYYAGYYREHGLPVMTFPWAVNLMRHFPVDVPVTRDAIFLGSYFEKPERLDAYLTATIRELNCTVFGPGWDASPLQLPDSRLEDFNRVAPELYSSHAVCLNIHHDYQAHGNSCNERGFNTLACGGFQVSDYARRLRHYFPEDEVVMGDDPDDFTDKVRHFVANPDERQAYMTRARARVFAEHTYQHRLADVVSYLLDGCALSEHHPVVGDSRSGAE